MDAAGGFCLACRADTVGDIAHAIIQPRLSMTPEYLTTAVTVLSTTSSMYLFF